MSRSVQGVLDDQLLDAVRSSSVRRRPVWLQIAAARPEPLAVIGVGRLEFGAEIQCGLAILLGALGQVYRLAPANAVALQRNHIVPQRILVAGEGLQYGSPPDVEVGVVLPGIADATMHLHVLQRHPLISGQRMSGSHRRGQIGLHTDQRARRPMWRPLASSVSTSMFAQ